jgi:hypothetical protein
MKLFRLQVFTGLFLAAILSVPVWATNAGANSALPGTLNYVEGQAQFNDQPLNAKSVGQAMLEVGQTLSTQNGKAEILLTPGVFLRAGNDTSVTMEADGLTNTALDLVQGHAMVEVADLYKQNDIRIRAGDATAHLLKAGLYDFDLNRNQIRVFDGKATVQEGDREVTVKSGHEVALANEAPKKAGKFDKKAYENDDLYKWSSLRSAYLAEANVDAARTVVVNGWYGPGWWGPGFWGPGFGGWWWDPWFSAYTFMPAGGIFYSPFGWGFYSPGLVYRAPITVVHSTHTFNAANVRAWSAGQHYALPNSYAHGVYTGPGATREAFHAGAVGAGARGGFGGGGGFHPAGGGGGFHGAAMSEGGMRGR